jgi:hypothetical protein
MGDNAGVVVLAETLFAVLIGGVTFWVACWAYNRLVGADSHGTVPLPTPRMAIGITVLLLIIDGLANVILGFCSDYLCGATRENHLQVVLGAGAVTFLAGAILASLLLPTTPRRAILVVLLQLAMEIVIAAAILAAAGIVDAVCR